MNEAIIKLHRAKLAPAVFSIIFGIALIIARKNAMDVAVKIGAVMLALGGLSCVLMYFFGPIRRETPQLGIGVTMIIIGLLLWFLSATLVDLFPVMAGLALLLNGLSNLAILRSPEEGTSKWLVILVSLAMAVGGFLILLHPGAIEDALMVYMGISFILNGILDLLLMHMAKEALLQAFVVQQSVAEAKQNIED